MLTFSRLVHVRIKAVVRKLQRLVREFLRNRPIELRVLRAHHGISVSDLVSWTVLYALLSQQRGPHGTLRHALLHSVNQNRVPIAGGFCDASAIHCHVPWRTRLVARASQQNEASWALFHAILSSYQRILRALYAFSIARFVPIWADSKALGPQLLRTVWTRGHDD